MFWNNTIKTKMRFHLSIYLLTKLKFILKIQKVPEIVEFQIMCGMASIKYKE